MVLGTGKGPHGSPLDHFLYLLKSSNKSTQYAMKVPKRAQVSSIAIELRKIEPIVTYHLIDNSLKSLAYEGTTFCRCAVNDFIRYLVNT